MEDPYEAMGKINSTTDVLVGDVGTLFGLGAVGGFLKGLMTGLGRHGHGHGTAFQLACRQALEIGGAGAVFGVVLTAVRLVDVTIRGKEDFYNCFFGSALATAAVQAKRGLRSASRSALAVGTGSTLLVAWLDAQRKKEDKLHYINNPPSARN